MRKNLWLVLAILLVISLGIGLLATPINADFTRLSSTSIAVVDDMSTTSQSGIETIIAQASSDTLTNINVNPDTGVPDGAILLTIFLKHDQSKTVDEILAELKQSGYWREFPPEGVSVVSWYVAMGLGHIVTLAVPPNMLRSVNVAIERTAWSAYRTEVYPTYDFSRSAQRLRQEMSQ